MRKRRIGPLSLFRVELRPGARGKGVARAMGPTAVGALAIGATALGAVAIGRLAIGRLAIGRLALGRGAIKQLEIEELEVGKLRVRELEIMGENGRVVKAVGVPLDEPGSPSPPTAE